VVVKDIHSKYKNKNGFIKKYPECGGLRVGELESWRVGELESWRVGELESWRVGYYKDIHSKYKNKNGFIKKYPEGLEVWCYKNTRSNYDNKYYYF